MSTTTLKHHFNTLAFLPRQKGRRIVKSLRSLKIRTSRRRLKQSIRQFIDTHSFLPSYTS